MKGQRRRDRFQAEKGEKERREHLGGTKGQGLGPRREQHVGAGTHAVRDRVVHLELGRDVAGRNRQYSLTRIVCDDRERGRCVGR